MRVLCRHGHYALYPRRASDAARYCQFFDTELERVEDFYTFPELVAAEHFSIAGREYLGLQATVTFEGRPWDVMRENGFVFDVSNRKLVLLGSVSLRVELPLSNHFYIAPPLVQPGSRDRSGRRILSYDGEYADGEFTRLYVRELEYE
jgi:hypothetical protein